MGQTFEMSCGGKGANQAIAAASLELSPVTLICRVGDDVFGDCLVKNFKVKGVSLDENVVLKGIYSGIASIVVDTKSGDNQIIVTPGANLRLEPDDVRNALERLASPPAIVLVQLEIKPETALQTLKAGKALGACTILNPAPAPQGFALNDWYQYTDVLIPNETELRKICGLTENYKPSYMTEEELATSLLQRGVGVAVVVTLGARGALVVTRTADNTVKATMVQQPIDLPCRNDPIQDTIGAGDGFCGSFSAYLAAGVELENAARLACGFASMSIRRRGAIYPTAIELPHCLKISSEVGL